MYNLGGTGYDSLKSIAVGSLLALGLKLQSDGISVDTVQNNAVQSVIAIVLTVLAFVD